MHIPPPHLSTLQTIGLWASMPVIVVVALGYGLRGELSEWLETWRVRDLIADMQRERGE